MSRIATSRDRLFELQRVCLSGNIAFVTFRLPESKDMCTFIQYKSQPQKISSLLQVDSQPGFLLAPFIHNEKYPIYLLKPDHIIYGYGVDEDILEEIRSLKKPDKEFTTSPVSLYECSKAEFLQEAKAIKNAIKSGSLDKAVLSRVHLAGNNFNLEGPEIFNALCNTYPNVFIYLLNIPVAGNWLGATPEPLLKVYDSVIETVSLAGTQKLNGVPVGKVVWNDKETEEQRIVTDFIENLLDSFGITNYQKYGPDSQQAANVVHLKSTFSFYRTSLKKTLGEFLSALHPTPSVCGLPKDEAFSLIHRLEKHERAYYTGFLGPLNFSGCSNLFVNLRCMRVLQNQFALFAGAGITSGSDPKNEWEETELKMQTLLSVLNNPDHDDE